MKHPIESHPSVFIEKGLMHIPMKEDKNEFIRWARSQGFELHCWPVADNNFLIEVIRELDKKDEIH